MSVYLIILNIMGLSSGVSAIIIIPLIVQTSQQAMHFSPPFFPRYAQFHKIFHPTKSYQLCINKFES